MHYLKYKENKHHGTDNFPVGYYQVTENHPQYAMPYHWHTELELIHINKGIFEITINENTRIAKPGDLLLVNSGYLHGGTPANCVYECLVFPLDLLFNPIHTSEFLTQLNKQDIILVEFYPVGSAFALQQLTNRIFSLMQNHQLQTKEGDELQFLGLLYQLLSILFKESYYCKSDKSDLVRHKNIYLLKNVLNYIETHYPEKIALDTLARIAGMSPKYFCRFFSEMLGRTPIDYVNFYRIERACSLLINTGHSITDIGMLCGFNDSSYFTRLFKKYKGISPRQYQNTAR